MFGNSLFDVQKKGLIKQVYDILKKALRTPFKKKDADRLNDNQIMMRTEVTELMAFEPIYMFMKLIPEKEETALQLIKS